MAPLFFLFEILALSTMVCVVFHYRRTIGLAPFYLLVGLFEAFLFVSTKSQIQIKAELFFTAPRGVYLAFLSLIMVSVVLVYVLEGTIEARRFILGIVILYVAHGVIDMLLEYHATHPPPGEPNQRGIDLLWYSTHARAASVGAMVADFVVIIIVYQFLHNRMQRVPLAIPIYLALIAGMITDAAVFKLIKHGALSWEIFHLGAKAQAGAAAGIPAALLFAWQLRKHSDDVREGILNRDTFDIVDLRDQVAHMRRELAEKQAQYDYVKSTFGEYVSAKVVDNLLEDPSKLELGGEARDVTILFADIRGYSTLSEQLTPHQVIDFLNRYFGEVGRVILDHDGMINEFEGDAVLAVFGAPAALERHAEMAVRTAIGMLEVVQKLNKAWDADGTLDAWRSAGLDGLAIRIGLHSGKVVAGNIGSADRKKYAVIGDTVNTASRVEGLNKVLGTSVLITEATRDALGEHALVDAFADAGVHQVKGRQGAVSVFSLDQERLLALPSTEQLAAPTSDPG